MAQDDYLRQLGHPFELLYRFRLHVEAHMCEALSELPRVPLRGEARQVGCPEDVQVSLVLLLLQNSQEWALFVRQVSLYLLVYDLRARNRRQALLVRRHGEGVVLACHRRGELEGGQSWREAIETECI